MKCFSCANECIFSLKGSLFSFLFNLNAKSQFLLHLLVSDLHAFVLVRSPLLVHLCNHQSQQNQVKLVSNLSPISHYHMYYLFIEISRDQTDLRKCKIHNIILTIKNFEVQRISMPCSLIFLTCLWQETQLTKQNSNTKPAKSTSPEWTKNQEIHQQQ